MPADLLVIDVARELQAMRRRIAIARADLPGVEPLVFMCSDFHRRVMRDLAPFLIVDLDAQPDTVNKIFGCEVIVTDHVEGWLLSQPSSTLSDFALF